MKRGFILSLIFLCVVTAATAQESGVPDWVTRKNDAWVEDGIIYSRGSAKLSSTAMSINASLARARSNISSALVNNVISGYASLPEDTKEPTTFEINEVCGAFGDITVLNRFIAGDNTVFTLISCTGAEIWSTMEYTLNSTEFLDFFEF